MSDLDRAGGYSGATERKLREAFLNDRLAAWIGTEFQFQVGGASQKSSIDATQQVSVFVSVTSWDVEIEPLAVQPTAPLNLELALSGSSIASNDEGGPVVETRRSSPVLVLDEEVDVNYVATSELFDALGEGVHVMPRDGNFAFPATPPSIGHTDSPHRCHDARRDAYPDPDFVDHAGSAEVGSNKEVEA